MTDPLSLSSNHRGFSFESKPPAAINQENDSEFLEQFEEALLERDQRIELLEHQIEAFSKKEKDFISLISTYENKLADLPVDFKPLIETPQILKELESHNKALEELLLCCETMNINGIANLQVSIKNQEFLGIDALKKGFEDQLARISGEYNHKIDELTENLKSELNEKQIFLAEIKDLSEKSRALALENKDLRQKTMELNNKIFELNMSLRSLKEKNAKEIIDSEEKRLKNKNLEEILTNNVIENLTKTLLTHSTNDKSMISHEKIENKHNDQAKMIENLTEKITQKLKIDMLSSQENENKEQQIKDLASKLEESERKAEYYQLENSRFLEKLTIFESKLKLAEQEKFQYIKEMEEKTNTLKKEIIELKEQSLENKEKSISFEEKHEESVEKAELQALLEEKEQKIVEFQALHTAQENQIKSLMKINQGLKHEMQETLLKIEEKEQALQNLVRENEALIKSVDSSNKKSLLSSSEKTSLKEHLNNLQQQLQEINKEKINLSRENEKINQEKQSVLKENQQIKEETHKIQHELAASSEEKSLLSANLAKILKALDLKESNLQQVLKENKVLKSLEEKHKEIEMLLQEKEETLQIKSANIQNLSEALDQKDKILKELLKKQDKIPDLEQKIMFIKSFLSESRDQIANIKENLKEIPISLENYRDNFVTELKNEIFSYFSALQAKNEEKMLLIQRIYEKKEASYRQNYESQISRLEKDLHNLSHSLPIKEKEESYLQEKPQKLLKSPMKLSTVSSASVSYNNPQQTQTPQNTNRIEFINYLSKKANLKPLFVPQNQESFVNDSNKNINFTPKEQNNRLSLKNNKSFTNNYSNFNESLPKRNNDILLSQRESFENTNTTQQEVLELKKSLDILHEEHQKLLNIIETNDKNQKSCTNEAFAVKCFDKIFDQLALSFEREGQLRATAQLLDEKLNKSLNGEQKFNDLKGVIEEKEKIIQTLEQENYEYKNLCKELQIQLDFKRAQMKFLQNEASKKEGKKLVEVKRDVSLTHVHGKNQEETESIPNLSINFQKPTFIGLKSPKTPEKTNNSEIRTKKEQGNYKTIVRGKSKNNPRWV